MQAELQATAQDLDQTREQLKLLQVSLGTASLELEAKEREKEGVKDDLKAMTDRLKTKQEDLDASMVGV